MKTALQAVRIGLGALALGATVAAQAAAPVITNITMVGATPRLTIQSDLVITNQIEYCTNLSQTNWLVLTNLLVAQRPYWFADVDAPPAPRRFYRVLAGSTKPPAPAGMVLIPAGSFTMGNCMDPSEGYSGELPLHTVYVSAFCMDTNLVTYSLWASVYQWATSHGYSFDNAGSGKAANHPVQAVNWYDAVKWCNARSEMGGLTPCYYTNASLSQMTIYRSGQLNLSNNWVNWVANGYRLPTEAEWEKAARGGASEHRFPWTDADTITWNRANFYGRPDLYSYDLNPSSGFDPAWKSGGFPYTSPVGHFAPNGYGLYDMAGNVWQWCSERCGDRYWSGSQSDPRGSDSDSDRRSIRGGSWGYHAMLCRTAYRGGFYATNNDWVVGFRSVLPSGQ